MILFVVSLEPQSEIQFIFIQFIYLMRNRNKYDWSKPFKLIDNKKAFDDLQTNEQNLIINIVDDQAEKAAANKKQDIPVPKIELVPKATVIKKFARITPNYIRLPPQLNLPNASSYELTQVDHLFLKSHENKFVFKGKKILTEAFLIKIITELQLKAGKDMTLPRNKGWLMSILQKDYKQLLQMENVQNFAQNVYNYWKNRREELKFPLLRLLWRPSPEEYNHMLAFRPREKDKRSLRRTNRVVQDEIVQELYEQFDLALKLADRIQVRQQLKYKQIQLQISSFYTQCKNYCTMHDDIDEIKMQQRSKDKQKLKRFHDDIQRYKNRKQSLENIKVQDTNTPNIDNKQSIINFLSTVVFEAEALGISHEKIFYSSNSFVDKPKIIVPPVGGNFIPQEIIPDIPQESIVVNESHLDFSVKKFQSKIYRTFSEDEQETYHVKPCKDYLEYKRRKVDKYYFGSDDEGQVKDLRKNISTSFKKFMQMQQTSKNLPITGQN